MQYCFTRNAWNFVANTVTLLQMKVEFDIESILNDIINSLDAIDVSFESLSFTEIDSLDVECLWESLLESFKDSSSSIKSLAASFSRKLYNYVIRALVSFKKQFIHLIMTIHFHSDLGYNTPVCYLRRYSLSARAFSSVTIPKL